MNSRVHPKYKTKYRVSNWAEYDRALVLRLVFNLPLRQAEGFLRSVLSLMALELEAPDHTTLSRRSRYLDV